MAASERDMPSVNQPLDRWAEALLDAALQRHTLWCLRHGLGAQVSDCREQISSLRLRLAALVAFMAGSGVLGGAAGAAVVRYVLGG